MNGALGMHDDHVYVASRQPSLLLPPPTISFLPPPPTHPLLVVTNVPHVRVESRHLAKKTLPAHLLHIFSAPLLPLALPLPRQCHWQTRSRNAPRDFCNFLMCSTYRKNYLSIKFLKISLKSFNYFCLFSFNQRASYFKWKTNIQHTLLLFYSWPFVGP